MDDIASPAAEPGVLPEVDDTALEAFDNERLPTLRRNKTVVGTCDWRRLPTQDEIVFVYGNYPRGPLNLVTDGIARRHASDFWRVYHDRFESDPRWGRVEQIYVVNMPARKDRWDSITRELASAGAPFDRVTTIAGATGKLSPMQSLQLRLRHVAAPGRFLSVKQISGSIGCGDSHLTALRDMLAKGYQNAIVLEDDFIFTPEIPSHLEDLKAFLDRGSAYKVCLLSTYKYGRLEELDELVVRTRQECTNTSAYCVSRSGATEVVAIWEEARELLRRTGEPKYALDRYWHRMQHGDDFLVFRNKFGFQQSGFSTIENRAVRYLD
jgi:hypothetical protein